MERVDGLFLYYPAGARVKRGLFQWERHVWSPFGDIQNWINLGSKYMLFLKKMRRLVPCMTLKQVMFVNTYGARCCAICTLFGGCTCQKRCILKRTDTYDRSPFGTSKIGANFGPKLGQNTCYILKMRRLVPCMAVNKYCLQTRKARVVGLFPHYLAGMCVESSLCQREGHTSWSWFERSKIASFFAWKLFAWVTTYTCTLFL